MIDLVRGITMEYTLVTEEDEGENIGIIISIVAFGTIDFMLIAETKCVMFLK